MSKRLWRFEVTHGNFINLTDSAKKAAHGSRNTNLSNYGQCAPKITSTDGSAALGPWDMDFNGYWEMEYDLIGEFMQNQQNRGGNKKISHNKSGIVVKKKKQAIDNVNKDDDDDMMMNCLPSCLVDESEKVGKQQQPPTTACFSSHQAQSVSSLQSKFDDKVKALWGNEPLAYKQQHFLEDDGVSLVSLASSFASEKNSLGLLNPTEQQRRFFIETEVNVPPFFNEMSSSYGGGKSKALIPEHDYNNNNFVSGGMSKSSSFTGSPHKQSSSTSSGDQSLKKFDFIKSGTNLQSSIWSYENFACEAESLLLKHEVSIVKYILRSTQIRVYKSEGVTLHLIYRLSWYFLYVYIEYIHIMQVSTVAAARSFYFSHDNSTHVF